MNCFVSSITKQFLSKMLDISGRKDLYLDPDFYFFPPQCSLLFCLALKIERRLVCTSCQKSHITSGISKAGILLYSSPAARVQSKCLYAVLYSNFTFPQCNQPRNTWNLAVSVTWTQMFLGCVPAGCHSCAFGCWCVNGIVWSVGGCCLLSRRRI